MNSKSIELIRQSLAAAEASIKTAKQLLSELESGKSQSQNQPAPDNQPGVVGVFNGESMTTEKGEDLPVPANYASKSLLVVGDTLKLVDEGKERRFKQIEHVKRLKTSGVLAKKDGKWKVVTPEGSYRVLPAAVEHFKADIGSQVTLQIPFGNLTSQWAALESVTGESKAESPVVAQETEKVLAAEVKEVGPKETQAKEESKEEKKEVSKPTEPRKSEPKVEKEAKPVEVPKPVPAPKKVEPALIAPKTAPVPAVPVSPPPELAPSPTPPSETPKSTPASTPTMEISPEEDELI